MRGGTSCRMRRWIQDQQISGSVSSERGPTDGRSLTRQGHTSRRIYISGSPGKMHASSTLYVRWEESRRSSQRPGTSRLTCAWRSPGWKHTTPPTSPSRRIPVVPGRHRGREGVRAARFAVRLRPLLDLLLSSMLPWGGREREVLRASRGAMREFGAPCCNGPFLVVMVALILAGSRSATFYAGGEDSDVGFLLETTSPRLANCRS